MTKKIKIKKTLENKVIGYRPLKDKKGRYIPYCDFGFHQGILTQPKICADRHCNHYKKLYI